MVLLSLMKHPRLLVCRCEVSTIVCLNSVLQALEVSCWIPLLHASRCVLAGDHHQLHPTILSDKFVFLMACVCLVGFDRCFPNRAAREGLSVTLMERSMAVCGKDNVVCMLTQQYRSVH